MKSKFSVKTQFPVPTIPALRVSLDYTMRPCLKNKTTRQNKKEGWEHGLSGIAPA
jgi:hypothetical protein